MKTIDDARKFLAKLDKLEESYGKLDREKATEEDIRKVMLDLKMLGSKSGNLAIADACAEAGATYRVRCRNAKDIADKRMAAAFAKCRRAFAGLDAALAEHGFDTVS